jgi:hypothetical protein
VRGLAVPLLGRLGVACYAHAFGVAAAQVELRPRVALGGGLAVPAARVMAPYRERRRGLLLLWKRKHTSQKQAPRIIERKKERERERERYIPPLNRNTDIGVDTSVFCVFIR